jgi:SAM-dependent methyltransferase
MITQESPALTAPAAAQPGQEKCPLCADPRPEVWMTAPDRFNGRQEQYRLVRCPKCSLVWLKDPPSLSEMGEHYGRDYDRTIAEAAKSPAHWFSRRDALVRLKLGGSVLDLGCGSGGFLSVVKSPSWKLYGVEISESAAKVARERCGAEVFVGNIVDAPFPPASFDAITCFNVFEHVYEPREVLRKVAEWLKPGGVFYTMMPNIDSAAARIFRSYWYALELPRHLFHFSPATLKRLAQASGLKEVSVTTHHETYFEASWRYVIDDVLRKIGRPRSPMAKLRVARLHAKIVSKAFRLTLLPVINAGISLAGDGETITAVFTK